MILCYLFLLHFIADFLLQSREMGKRKSEEVKWLFAHLLFQFAVFDFGIFIMLDIIYIFYIPIPLMYVLMLSLKFATLNTLIHGIIDWNIWRLYKLSVKWRNKDKTAEELKNTWKFWDDHLFFTTIGFDQLLHMCTIVIIWNLLI